MAIRAAHGKAAERGKVAVVELPLKELARGVPAPAQPAARRNPNGTFQKGAGTAAIAAKGGRAKAEQEKLRRLMGLVEPPEHMAPYWRFAEQWRDEQLARLAERVGGGEVGPAGLMLVSNAARMMIASLMFADVAQAEDISPKDALLYSEKSARFAEQAKGQLIAAHELTAKEARAKPKGQQGSAPNTSLSPEEVRQIFGLGPNNPDEEP